MAITTFASGVHDAHSAALRQRYRISEEDISTADVQNQTRLVSMGKGVTIVWGAERLLLHPLLCVVEVVEPLDGRRGFPCKGLRRFRSDEQRMQGVLAVYTARSSLRAMLNKRVVDQP